MPVWVAVHLQIKSFSAFLFHIYYLQASKMSVMYMISKLSKYNCKNEQLLSLVLKISEFMGSVGNKFHFLIMDGKGRHICNTFTPQIKGSH